MRYSYRLQPTIIWWNLTRLGEALGELMGSMSHVDDETYISGEYSEDQKAEVVKHGERIIEEVGEEYKSLFLEEYKKLMSKVIVFGEGTDSSGWGCKHRKKRIWISIPRCCRCWKIRIVISVTSFIDLETRQSSPSTARKNIHEQQNIFSPRTRKTKRRELKRWRHGWRLSTVPGWRKRGV